MATDFDYSDFEIAFDDDASKALEAPERPQSANRAYAQDLADHWLKQVRVKHWPNLDKKRIRRGLHARIANPDLIKQGPTGLCGPAAFLRALARENPCEFALFGGLLYSLGYANLGRGRRIFKKVQPSLTTKLSKVPPGMDHTDWLILASLRDAFNDFFNYSWDDVNQMTGMSVSSVAEFFRAAGYSQVVEDLGGSAIFKGSVSKGVENIDKANEYFRRGYQVLLLVDSEILKTAEPGVSPFANHWIALRATIDVHRFWKKWSQNELARIGVQIAKVWSWGNPDKARIPPLPADYMSFENFTKCYYGFVAAKVAT